MEVFLRDPSTYLRECPFIEKVDIIKIEIVIYDAEEQSLSSYIFSKILHSATGIEVTDNFTKKNLS